MPTLRIEHPVTDFDTWKAVIDSDTARELRKQSGVRRYRIFRPIDDPKYIMMDLDFDSSAEAESFLAVMRDRWQSREATPALSGIPQARIVEAVDSKEQG